MPSARTRGVVGSALAVMGFRTKGSGWSYSTADEPVITAELGGTTVLLTAPGASLSVAVKRPLAADFVPRLRKRLGSLKKRAAKAEKQAKKASRSTLATAEALTAALKARKTSDDREGYLGGEAVRQYDPIAYCERGKHFTRESLMVNATECGDCAGWLLRSR